LEEALVCESLAGLLFELPKLAVPGLGLRDHAGQAVPAVDQLELQFQFHLMWGPARLTLRRAWAVSCIALTNPRTLQHDEWLTTRSGCTGW
jgi:hypothetical protein